MAMNIRKARAAVLAGALLSSVAGQAPRAEGPSTAIQRRAAPPARINNFTVQPGSIQPGQSVMLVWAVENPQATTIDQGVGVVTPRGSRRVSPAATTTYTLTTRGPNGTVTKAVTVTVAGTAPVGTNQLETAKQEVPRTPEGKPDLSGVYGFAGARNTPAPALKPGAEKFKVVHGPNFVGLTADCMPLGVPGSFGVPYPFQIAQTPNLLMIFYEYPNTFRIIPTDGRPHPVDPDPTWMGNSVGHWEEDTLVIDTIGFNEKTEVNGYRHTDAMHVVERIRRIEVGSLQYDVIIEDPNVFAAPWVMPTRSFPLRPELEKIDEFVCEQPRLHPVVQQEGLAAAEDASVLQGESMKAINEITITDAAIEQMATTQDPRLKTIMAAAVRHLHAWAREVDLTPEEWIAGIGFLTAVGQKCTAFRQEFILLSDTLGLSSLVNSLHDKRATEDGTKSSLLGPFYRQDSPQRKLGETIATKTAAPQIAIYGRVTNANGQGIPNASVEVWQPDEEGWYDLQKHDPSEMDLRGCFHTDSEGRYHLRTIRPCGYMIPMDGPVGDMIRAQGRHGYRPAHIHFLVGAPKHRECVTALYLAGDDHIDSDTVFGVTESLVTDTKNNDTSSPLPGLPSIRFDFTLAAAKDALSGRVGADPSQFIKNAADGAH